MKQKKFKDLNIGEKFVESKEYTTLLEKISKTHAGKRGIITDGIIVEFRVNPDREVWVNAEGIE